MKNLIRKIKRTMSIYNLMNVFNKMFEGGRENVKYNIFDRIKILFSSDNDQRELYDGLSNVIYGV